MQSHYSSGATALAREGTSQADPLLQTLLVRIGRELMQNKLLYQGIGQAASGVDGGAGEDQSGPAIAWWIVEVVQRGRD